MKTRLALALLIAWLPCLAAAQACQHLEFAELNAMNDGELLAARCEYRKTLERAIAERRSTFETTSGCVDQIERTDRILARRHGLGIEPREYGPKIQALCGEIPAR